MGDGLEHEVSFHIEARTRYAALDPSFEMRIARVRTIRDCRLSMDRPVALTCGATRAFVWVCPPAWL
jgi:hypothetical protein